MRKIIKEICFILGCFFLATFSAHAASPSFDCKLAKSLVEKAICADDNIAVLDKKIGDTYAQLLTLWDDPRKESLIKGQRTWLRLRDAACAPYFHATDQSTHRWATPSHCLEGVLKSRIDELKNSYAHPSNDVTFLHPLSLQEFPYKEYVKSVDVEKLLDIPFESSDDHFAVHEPISDDHVVQVTIHTCREWNVYSAAGWSGTGMYPFSVEASFEGKIGAICGLINMLRTTYPVKSSFIPKSVAFLDIRRYGKDFFDQPWGATQDYSVPPPNPDAESFGTFIKNQNIKVVNKDSPAGYGNQPDDEIWILKSRKNMSISFISNQTEVTLSPILKAAFDESGQEDVLLEWSSSMGNSARFGGDKIVTVLKDGGAIVEVPDSRTH